jgi:hypothetical protein
MAEFTLKKREEDWLKLNVGEDSFNIPLANSMTFDEAALMESMTGAIEFFRKYIKEEIANALTLGDWKDLITAWREASEKVMKPGDSETGES